MSFFKVKIKVLVSVCCLAGLITCFALLTSCGGIAGGGTVERFENDLLILSGGLSNWDNLGSSSGRCMGGGTAFNNTEAGFTNQSICIQDSPFATGNVGVVADEIAVLDFSGYLTQDYDAVTLNGKVFYKIKSSGLRVGPSVFSVVDRLQYFYVKNNNVVRIEVDDRGAEHSRIETFIGDIAFKDSLPNPLETVTMSNNFKLYVPKLPITVNVNEPIHIEMVPDSAYLKPTTNMLISTVGASGVAVGGISGSNISFPFSGTKGVFKTLTATAANQSFELVIKARDPDNTSIILATSTLNVTVN